MAELQTKSAVKDSCYTSYNGSVGQSVLQ